jgi:hypothetical protein
MWIINSLESRQTTMNFASSGQGQPSVHHLVFDGSVVANAIELTDWADGPIQFELCGECGVVHCKCGGWGVARSIGEAVIFMPAFGAMADDPAEYAPPTWMSERGPALVPSSLVERLRRAVPSFPETQSLQGLSASEAIRSIQLSAPLQILGKFPEAPAIQRGKLIAVSKGDLPEVATELDRLLTSLTTQEPVRLRKLDGPEGEVAFYLDAIGYPEWTPLVELKGRGPALKWGPYIIESGTTPNPVGRVDG